MCFKEISFMGKEAIAKGMWPSLMQPLGYLYLNLHLGLSYHIILYPNHSHHNIIRIHNNVPWEILV